MGDDLDNGSVASLIVRKKGVARGPKGNRTVYGDDLVHVLLWTGFHYQALVERSFKKLHQMWGKGNLLRKLLKAVQDAGLTGANVEDVALAVQEIDESFLRVIRTNEAAPREETTQGDAPEAPKPVWEPLKVDGTVIRGAKVYKGGGDLTDPRAPLPGTIYIDGVKLGEKVLDPAPNGQWCPKQKAKTVAKDILRSWLPAGLYARYSLEQDRVQTIKVGADASAHAKAAKVPVDPEAIRSLFKVAP